MSEVFISYRREGGSDLASFLEAKLQSYGFDATIDVGNRYTGDFIQYIENEVKDCTLFIVLITKGSIPRMVDPKDISREEIEYAFKYGKAILPIIMHDVDMFKDITDHADSLPEEVKKLAKINCRFYRHEMREDTLSYIVDLARTLRHERLINTKGQKVSESTYSLIPEIETYIKNGEGVEVTLPSGQKAIYDGTLVLNGLPFGKGKLVIPNSGMEYELDWHVADKFSGKGVVRKNGIVYYEGNLTELLFQGTGILHEKDYTHTGQFEGGIIKGYGTRVYKDGTVMEGVWIKDNLIKDPLIKFKNGDIFRGKYIGGKPSGNGTLIRGEKRITAFFRDFTRVSNALVETDLEVYLGDLDEELNYTGNGIILDSNRNPLYKGRFNKGSAQGFGELFLTPSSLGTVLDDMPYSMLQANLDDFSVDMLIVSGQFDQGSLSKGVGYQVLDSQRRLIMKSLPENHKGESMIETYDNLENIQLKVKV